MKACTKCGRTDVKFSRNKRTRDGLASWCNSCNSATEKIRRRKRDPRDNARKDFVTNLRRYSLSVQEFAILWLNSDGRCSNPGCRKDLDLDTRDWAVDHDHSCCSGMRSCGKCVRGLLCRGCNSALGHIEDSARKATGLSTYLLSFRR